MTVSTTTVVIPYSGDGTTTAFPVTFQVGAATEVVAVLTDSEGVETTQLLGSDYTVTLSAAGTGTLTMGTPPPAGSTLRLTRRTPPVQPDSLRNQGNYYPETVEKMFDRLTRRVQEVEVTSLLEEFALLSEEGLLIGEGDGIFGGNTAEAEALVAAVRSDLASTAADKGAALVGWNRGVAGAIARTLHDRAKDTLHAADFGVVGDNTTDNADALDAVIAEAVSRGGARILLPAGRIKHSNEIVISESNITLEGEGRNMPHDGGSGPTVVGTKLTYIGANTSGVHVTFTSTAGAAEQKKSGGGLRNVWLNAPGTTPIGTGLLVRSFNNALFENVWLVGHTAYGVRIDVLSGSLAEAKDSQRNRFVNVQVEGKPAQVLWYLEGGATANASFNYFFQCGGRHSNSTAWLLGNSDNNLFIQCGAYRVAGGTGYNVEFLGANAGNAPSRSNHFISLSGNGGVIARGTTSYTDPSVRNTISHYDQDNGSPAPVIETGAGLTWSTDDGFRYNEALIGGVFTESPITADDARAARGTESVRIQNGSSNHIRMTDGVHEWSISLDGSGDLRVLKVSGAGAGRLLMGENVSYGTYNASADAAVSGYITILDAAGNARKLATIT